MQAWVQYLIPSLAILIRHQALCLVRVINDSLTGQPPFHLSRRLWPGHIDLYPRLSFYNQPEETGRRLQLFAQNEVDDIVQGVREIEDRFNQYLGYPHVFLSEE